MTDFTNFLNEDIVPDDADMYSYEIDQLHSLCKTDVEQLKVNMFNIFKDNRDRWCVTMGWTDYTQMYAGGDYHSVSDMPLALIQDSLDYDQRLLLHFHITDYHKRITIEARHIKGNYATFEAVLKGEC